MTEPTEAEIDLARGLQAGHRYRCGACANLTRFDVVTTERARRFHHLELGGVGAVEEEEILSQTVDSVTCRWCGRGDAIVVEPVDDLAGPADRTATER